MSATCLLVGEYRDFPAQTFNVTANSNTEAKSIATGSYYLIDGDPTLSLCKLLELQLEDHGDITTATVGVQEDRKIYATCDVDFEIEWTSSGTYLQAVLGADDDWDTATTDTFRGDTVSTYLWSPNRTESSRNAPLGVHGVDEIDLFVSNPPSGNIVGTSQNTRTVNEFFWRHVAAARTFTASEAGGEHYTFWRDVLSKLWRFKLYRDLTDDESSTTPLTLGTPLGPYKWLPPRNGLVRYPYDREAEAGLTDFLLAIELACIKVPEIS